MGWSITKVENFLRNRIENTEHRVQTPDLKEKWAGIFLVVIIVGFTYGLFYVINSLFTVHRSLFTVLLMIYLVSTTIATCELIKSARSIIKTLNVSGIESAREKLSHIVGRDTKTLDKNSILKATIESLAENVSDGIIAPLFYFSIGGLPLAMTYKAINTMDSMVGHKNERYRHFGWAAARLDDIANYIPARISGILIVASAFFITILKRPPETLRITHHALRTMFRDGRNHPSPNSGVPEAAMAGAIGIRLGGPSSYCGIVVEKPYIGEEIQNTEHRIQSTDNPYLDASEKAITITKITSLLGLTIATAILYVRTAI